MKKLGFILSIILLFVLSSWQSNKKLHHSKNKRDEIKAFTFGEKLKYKISLGFIDAGFAELEVKKYEDENAYFHVIGTGYSNSTVDYFFKIRDRYESIIDSSSLCPIKFIRSVEEGNASFKQNYIFNQRDKTVFDGKSEISTCADIQDMVSCYFFARNLDLKNLKKGEILTFPTFVDGETFKLKVKFIGKENVKVKAGNFKALKFCPVVQRGRVFKNEESLTVWISDDYNKIPLLAKAKIWVGSIKMELQEMHGELNKSGLIDQ